MRFLSMVDVTVAPPDPVATGRLMASLLRQIAERGITFSSPTSPGAVGYIEVSGEPLWLTGEEAQLLMRLVEGS